MKNAPTLASLADDLESGRTSARKLVDECLARIADPSGEGARTFIHVDAEAAIEAAEAMDRLREVKAAPSRYAGIPVSIKDLFDIKGQVTRAGSRALEDSAPAEADAPVVARLRRAGFVVIGRTNMTEFAYSGIGINPHYGTPKGAWQRGVGHVPGGSSSGAAVSVVDAMAYGALGTDTGGSCRIPAAYNGIVGFKPTQRRVPLEGGVPLSFTLDSFGPLARTVDCCAVLDAVLADETIVPLQPRPIKGMRLAVPTTVALDELEDDVARTFERALETLSRQGALIERIEVPEFLDIGVMNTKGGFAAAESYAWHRYLIVSHGDVYDPRVCMRIVRGESISAADYIDLLGMRLIYYKPGDVFGVDNQGGPICFLRFGQNSLYFRKSQRPDHKPYVAHFTPMIENYDQMAVKAELERRGFKPQPDTKYGWQIQDPAGMRMEVAGPGVPEHIGGDCNGGNAGCPGGPDK